MSSVDRISTRRAAALLVLAVGATSVSCDNKNVNNEVATVTAPNSSALTRRAIGVAEVTFRDITSTKISSTLRLFASVADLERLRATSGAGNLDTITVEPLVTAEFTDMPAGGPAFRFVRATFGLHNVRGNVSFVALRTANTIADTPVRFIQRADGSAVADALAQQVTPTGLFAVNAEGQLVSIGSNVLTTLTDDDTRRTGLPTGAAGVFLYSFPVLPFSAFASENDSSNAQAFDGVVTFAYRLPIAPTATDNPTTFSVLFLIVDDTVAPRSP